MRLADGDIVDMSTGDTFDWKQSLWFGNSKVKLVCAPKYMRKKSIIIMSYQLLDNLNDETDNRRSFGRSIRRGKIDRNNLYYQVPSHSNKTSSVLSHTPVMPWLFMWPILYSAFSEGNSAAPMVIPSITALNLRTMGFFSRPSGS